jgi:hypothetical protein
MKINDLIEEVYASGPKMYAAYSSAPRKDFVPYSTKDGYNFPYQKNAPPIHPPSAPQPPNTVSMPWPLQTINDDLSDGYIYLLAAAKKLSVCAKGNPSLTEEQKQQLITLYKELKIALQKIKNVGLNVTDVVNMSLPLSPQVPVQSASIVPEKPFN